MFHYFLFPRTEYPEYTLRFVREYPSETSRLVAEDCFVVFVKLIDVNYKKVKFPKEYARIMQMSEKHLNRICKHCLNKTTTDPIAESIILEAKRMLVFSKNSVSEIIAEFGYTDNSYFFRFLRKRQ